MEVRRYDEYGEVVAGAGKLVLHVASGRTGRRMPVYGGDAEGYVEIDEADSRLTAVRAAKISAIEAYDAGAAVNGFRINGRRVWYDKATRVGLRASLSDEREAGHETTVLWYGLERYEVGTDDAISMMKEVELYALACFNVTAEHKAAVMALGTVREIEEYDITAGYPAQPEFEI